MPHSMVITPLALLKVAGGPVLDGYTQTMPLNHETRGTTGASPGAKRIRELASGGGAPDRSRPAQVMEM